MSRQDFMNKKYVNKARTIMLRSQGSDNAAMNAKLSKHNSESKYLNTSRGKHCTKHNLVSVKLG